MPPPHFTPTSAGAAGAALAQVDVPKSIRASLKELSVRLRAALVSDEQTSAVALPLALSAIQGLLNDPNLPPAPTSTGSSSSGGSGGGSSGSSSAAAVAAANISTASTSGPNNTNAQAVAATKAQLRAHLASKVNAELLDIYNDDMDQEDLKSTSSLVEILQRLSPLLGPACIVLEWWDLVLHEAKDEQEAEAKAQTLAAPETEDVGIVDPAATKVQSWSGDLDAAPLIDVVGTTWKGNLETILIAFGSLRPKELFHHLAESFDDPLARVPILLLLSIFLRLYSMHAPLATRTALPRMLVLSAQLDTSTTSTALCITALVMLLPHIANWIANGGAGGLPTFLAIYARVIDWRKLGVGWETRTGSDDGMEELRRQYDEEFAEVDRLGKRLLARPDLNWRRLAPIDYLRKAQYDSPVAGSWEDMMDELAVQSRSAPVLRAHTLHPALVSLSAEKEVSDTQRWLQHEPADITAECISLHLGARHEGHAATSERRPLGQLQFTSTGTATPATSRFHSSRGAEHDGTPISKQLHTSAVESSALVAQNISHRRGSTHSSGGGHHEFSFESTPDSRMLTDYAALRWAAPLTSTGALRPFAFDSPTGFLALSPARNNTLAASGLLSRLHLGGTARPARSEVYNELAYAQRENLLLRNELNFELSLRTRISTTMAAQEKQRMEAASTKSRHAAWESELNAKLRTYREERKVWTNESRELRAALEDARATSQSQARQLEEDAKELFELRQQVEADRKKVKQIAEYEVKIRQLSSMLSMWDEDVRRYDQQRREMELLLSRWHEMEMMLQASDDDAGNLRSLSESQAARIETLERDLSLIRSDALRLRSSQHQDSSASALHPPSTHGNATREAALEAEKMRMQSHIETLEAQALDLRVRAESAEATLALKLKASPTKSKDLEQLDPELHDAARSSSHAGDAWIQDALHAQIPSLSLGASHGQDAVTPSALTAADLSTHAEDAPKVGSVAGKADL
ncbi:HAMARTIN [Ceraceosorus bombacis]|uniref:HAMARTIN n=1 Tax=Ceraceosorus bombacis TaxID=401625 RepID=A0A0N7LB28_9BASI|nr:HAMARTIN [Ceraceosorus bombacis]